MRILHSRDERPSTNFRGSRMKFIISIFHVDGVSDCGIATPQAQEALGFLRRHDHKGSSVDMTIEVKESELVYKILNLIMKEMLQ